MTALIADRLTIADAARMLRDELKDRSYVTTTPLGGEVDRFLRYFATEYGAMPTSVTGYEYTLARLALYYADLTLADLEPPDGIDLIRQFWHHYWGDAEPTTRTNRLGVLKSFFRWAVEERRMIADPTRAIRYPRGRGKERKTHSIEEIQRILLAQERREDKIGVQLMARMGLRRNELRLVQARHIDADTGTLTVFGKGGTVEPVPLFPDLRSQIMALALDRMWLPDEFLLYPRKTGLKRGEMQVIWEDRRKPVSLSAIDKWWRRCLDRAGVPCFPMHELRHTAGTEFYKQTRDLKLTQRLLRHKHAKTTADVYLHLDTADLATAMDKLEAW